MINILIRICIYLYLCYFLNRNDDSCYDIPPLLFVEAHKLCHLSLTYEDIMNNYLLMKEWNCENDHALLDWISKKYV